MAETGDVSAARRTSDGPNDHLSYVDSNAYGLGLVTVRRDNISVEMLTTRPPVTPPPENGMPVLRRACFTVSPTTDGQVELQGPFIEGPPPFPLAADRSDSKRGRLTKPERKY